VYLSFRRYLIDVRYLIGVCHLISLG